MPAALRRGILGLLLLAALARMPFSATHLDLARDMFIAQRLLDGEALPLAGPVLAGTIHLGPAWYWLLAGLLAVGGSWLGALFGLGALAGTQYGLAYLAGRELQGRDAGVLWAVGLALPSWSAYEWLMPLHTLLTAPLVLLVLLSGARYLRTARLRYLVGLLLGAVLALHAHPSTAGLACIVAFVLGLAAWRGTLRWRALALALLLALLPLLPYVAWSIDNGFADFRAGSRYLMDGQSTGSAAALLPILAQTAWGGTRYWLETLLEWPALAVNLTGIALAAVALAAARGLCRPAGQRAVPVAVVLAALGAVGLTIAVIRHGTTYYMTTPLRVLLLGAVAIGLARLGGARAAARLRVAIAAAALTLAGVAGVSAHARLAGGQWPFAFLPLFDVTAPAVPPQRLPLLPAFAMADSGRLLCASPAPQAHGAYARHLLYDYAIEMRQGCARRDVAIGGSADAGAGWFGLAYGPAVAAGLAPPRRLGSLALFPVRRTLDGAAFSPPALPVYPIHVPRETPYAERRYTLRLEAGERVAVANLAYFTPPPQVRELAASPRLRPRVADAVSQVWDCAACAPGVTTDVELAVAGAYLDDTEIVVF